MKIKKTRPYFYAGGIAVAIVGGMYYASLINDNTSQKSLEGRYIRMSETNPSPKDLDKDGLSELTLGFKDGNYVLREVDGKPVLTEYEIGKKGEYILKD